MNASVPAIAIAPQMRLEPGLALVLLQRALGLRTAADAALAANADPRWTRRLKETAENHHGLVSRLRAELRTARIGDGV
jgi:hypothetical protein